MPSDNSYVPGDCVSVVDGTFRGMRGVVVGRKEAKAIHVAVGGEPQLAEHGFVSVVLPLFGRRVPVNLHFSQLRSDA